MKMRQVTLSSEIIKKAVAKVLAEESAGMLEGMEVTDLKAVIGGRPYAFMSVTAGLQPKKEGQTDIQSAPPQAIERKTATGRLVSLATVNGQKVGDE